MLTGRLLRWGLPGGYHPSGDGRRGTFVRGGSGAGPQGFEVQVALDGSQGLVVDDPGITQADHGLSLCDEDRVSDRPVVEELLLGLVDGRTSARQHMARFVLVLLPQLLDQRKMVRVVVLQLFEPLERRLHRGESGVDLLPILPGGCQNAQVADQPGQRQALPDQGRGDDTEREEQDEVTRWEVAW